jgi:hypothetical protein
MSGILAYGLQQMDGVKGIRGWRWRVRPLQLSPSNVLIARRIFAITFIVKFPDEEKAKSSWRCLKPDELDVVVDRLNADRNDAGAEKFSWNKFLGPAKDWYIYVFALILLFVTTIAYGKCSLYELCVRIY